MEKKKSWSQMLPDILESISDRLPLFDYLSFRHVCHSWRSSPSGRSEIISFPKEKPWLLLYDIHNKGDDGAKCYLYCSSHPSCCTFHLPHLRAASIVQSKFGWFLVHINGQFFFFNPITLQKIDLPKHRISDDQVCTFTCEPTKPGCFVFIVSRWKELELEVSSYQVDETSAKWTSKSLQVDTSKISPMITLATGCCCRKINNITCCKNKNTITVHGSKFGWRYDYEKSTSKTGEHPLSAQASKKTRDILDTHHSDLLRKFGKNGITVSTCACSVHENEKEYIDLPGTPSITAAHDSQKVQPGKLNLVKGAWLEAYNLHLGNNTRAS